MENDPFGTFKGIDPEKQPEDDQEEPDLIDAVIEYRKNHPRTAGEAFREDINKEIVRHVKELGRLTRIAAEELGETNKITITGHRERDPYPDNFTHQYSHTPNGLAEMCPQPAEGQENPSFKGFSQEIADSKIDLTKIPRKEIMSDEEANRLIHEINSTEALKQIHGTIAHLQSMCDTAADKLGMNIEINMAAHANMPRKKPHVTIYQMSELQARQDSLQNFEKE